MGRKMRGGGREGTEEEGRGGEGKDGKGGERR